MCNIKKENTKMMFLDELPTKGTRINWKQCIKMKVRGIYNNINFEVEIVDYKNGYLYLKYLNKDIFKIKTEHFRNCKLGKLLNNDKFKIEIGTTFKDSKRDLIIIDKKCRKDKEGNTRNWYKYRCNKCGFECGEHYKDGKYEKELWVIKSSLLNGTGCSCCSTSSKIVVSGINDIPTTNPEMIKYFQGGYDEAKKYTKSSRQTIIPVCPDCGKKKETFMKINSIYEQGIACNYCGDGKSYPEKFTFNMLEQLNIEFETEYIPDWVKPRRFDFYFELNNKKYIIETDGNFHNKDNEMNGQTKEESKFIDDEKDRLAKEHNIEVIRIDSEKSDLDYIKNNIIDSKLNDLFNLSNIDWLECHEFALSNLVKKACEISKNNADMASIEIGKIMKLNKTTIIRYLKQGTKLGWCKYNPKDESLKGNKKSTNGKPVAIFKDGVKLGEFKSCVELSNLSEEKFGVKLNYSNISDVCRNSHSQYKNYKFIYI